MPQNPGSGLPPKPKSTTTDPKPKPKESKLDKLEDQFPEEKMTQAKETLSKVRKDAE